MKNKRLTSNIFSFTKIETAKVLSKIRNFIGLKTSQKNLTSESGESKVLDYMHMRHLGFHPPDAYIIPECDGVTPDWRKYIYVQQSTLKELIDGSEEDFEVAAGLFDVKGISFKPEGDRPRVYHTWSDIRKLREIRARMTGDLKKRTDERIKSSTDG